MTDEKVFFRVKEAEKFLGVSRTTLWRMERDGRLHERIQISGRWCGWRREWLVECLEGLMNGERKANHSPNEESNFDMISNKI